MPNLKFHIKKGSLPNEATFLVQRATDAAFTQNVVTVQDWGIANLIADLLTDTSDSYYYRCKAKTATNESAWSAPIKGFTSQGAPMLLHIWDEVYSDNSEVYNPWANELLSLAGINAEFRFALSTGVRNADTVLEGVDVLVFVSSRTTEADYLTALEQTQLKENTFPLWTLAESEAGGVDQSKDFHPQDIHLDKGRYFKYRYSNPTIKHSFSNSYNHFELYTNECAYGTPSNPWSIAETLTTYNDFYLKFVATNAIGEATLGGEQTPWMRGRCLKLATMQATATGEQQRIRLSWTPINGADRYQIFQKDSNGAFVLINEVTGATTEVVITGLLDKTQYTHRVVALTGTQKLAHVIKDATTLAPVFNLKLDSTSIQSDRCRIYWDSVGLSFETIEISPSAAVNDPSGSMVTITTVPEEPATTDALLYQLTQGTTYTVTVSGSPNGVSVRETITFTTPLAAPKIVNWNANYVPGTNDLPRNNVGIDVTFDKEVSLWDTQWIRFGIAGAAGSVSPTSSGTTSNQAFSINKTGPTTIHVFVAGPLVAGDTYCLWFGQNSITAVDGTKLGPYSFRNFMIS